MEGAIFKLKKKNYIDVIVAYRRAAWDSIERWKQFPSSLIHHIFLTIVLTSIFIRKALALKYCDI